MGRHGSGVNCIDMGLYLTLAAAAFGVLVWLLYRLDVAVRRLPGRQGSGTVPELTNDVISADTPSLGLVAVEPEPWRLEIQTFALRPLGDLPFECFADPNALSGQIESSLQQERHVSWTGRIGDWLRSHNFGPSGG